MIRCNQTGDGMEMRCKCKIFIDHELEMPKIESFQNGDVRGLRRVPVLWVLITTFVPVLLQKPVLLLLLLLLLTPASFSRIKPLTQYRYYTAAFYYTRYRCLNLMNLSSHSVFHKSSTNISKTITLIYVTD